MLMKLVSIVLLFVRTDGHGELTVQSGSLQKVVRVKTEATQGASPVRFIREIVPILSGIDYERGDELVFVPILPSDPFPQQPAVPSNEELPDAMKKAVSEESIGIPECS